MSEWTPPENAILIEGEVETSSDSLVELETGQEWTPPANAILVEDEVVLEGEVVPEENHISIEDWSKEEEDFIKDLNPKLKKLYPLFEFEESGMDDQITVTNKQTGESDYFDLGSTDFFKSDFDSFKKWIDDQKSKTTTIDKDKIKIYEELELNPGAQLGSVTYNDLYDITIEGETYKEPMYGSSFEDGSEKLLYRESKTPSRLSTKEEVVKLINVVDSLQQDAFANPYKYGIGLEDAPAIQKLDLEIPEHRTIKKSVIEQVKEVTGLNISKDSFNYIYNKLAPKSKSKVETEYEKNKIKPGDDLNPTFELEFAEELDEGKSEGQLNLEGYNEQQFNITQELNKINYDIEQTKNNTSLTDVQQERKLNDLEKRKTQLEKTNKSLDYLIKNQSEALGREDYIFPSWMAATIAAPLMWGERLVKLGDKTTEELSAKFFDDKGYSKESAKKLAEVTNNTYRTAGVAAQGLMLENPKLSQREAIESLYKNEVLYLQQLKSGDGQKTVELNVDLGSATGALKNIYLPSAWDKIREYPNKYEDLGNGKIKISYQALRDMGIDSRNFSGWFDNMVGLADEKTISSIKAYNEEVDEATAVAMGYRNLWRNNVDVGTIEKPDVVTNFFEQASTATLEYTGLNNKEAKEFLTGTKEGFARDRIDNLNEAISIANSTPEVEQAMGGKIELTPTQKENIDVSLSEEVSSGVAAFAPDLVILGATGGTMNALGYAKLMHKLSPMARFLTGAVVEEAKMQLILGMKPGGGATFYTLGAATTNLTPFNKRYKWLKPLFDKVVKAGPVGAISAETAQVSELAYESLMGDKNFKDEFEELYSDFDEVSRRMLVNSMVFSLTGVTHVKKGDFQSTRQKYKLIAELEKRRNALMNIPKDPKAEVEKDGVILPTTKKKYDDLSPKEKKKFNEYSERILKLSQQVQVETMHHKLDPNSKNFEKDFNKMVTKPMNKGIQSVVPEFEGVKVRFGKGKDFRRKNFQTNEKGEDLGNTAQYNPETNEMFFDLNKYTAGKPAHEFTHAATEAYFKANPTAERNFTKRMGQIFKDFDFGEFSGTELEARIKEVYGTDLRTTQGKNLTAKEYLAFMAEIMADPKIYYTNPKLASSFMNEFRLEVKDILIESGLKTPTPKTAKDMVELMALLGKSTRMGTKLNVKASVLAKLDEIDILGTRLIEGNREAEGKKVASKDLTKSTPLQEINKLIPQEVKSKEDYDQYIRDPRRGQRLISSIYTPGEVINNYIRSRQESKAEGDKIIDNVADRILNFNPESKRADGSIVGIEGFGESIFANTRFGKLDAKKELAIEAERKKKTVSTDDKQARQITYTKTSPKTEDKKAKVTPKSKIPKDFPEIFTEDLKNEIDAAALEIFEGETPGVTEKEFKGFVTESYRGKLTNKIKKALGGGKSYEFSVKKMAPKMKESLDPRFFVRLESQTKPENRIFTKPPRRLTKQAEIDAAMLNDKVYVENTAQGVNLYEFKDFTSKQLIDYILAPTINPKTGAKSGLRGTRKTAFAEGIVDRIGRDVTPQAVKKIGKEPREVAEISKKMQVDPSTILAAKELKIGERWKEEQKKKGAKHIEDLIGTLDLVPRIKEVMVDIAPKYFGNILDRVGGLLGTSIWANSGVRIGKASRDGMPLVSGIDAAIGKQAKKQAKANFKERGIESPTEAQMKKEIDKEIKNINKGQDIELSREAVSAGLTMEQPQLVKEVLEVVRNTPELAEKFSKEQIEKINLAIDNQDVRKLSKNIKNKDKFLEGKSLLLDAYKDLLTAHPEAIDIMTQLLYHKNSNTHVLRNLATYLGTELDIIDRPQLRNKPYEEHTLPFGEATLLILDAIQSKKTDWKGFKKWLNNNYFQEGISSAPDGKGNVYGYSQNILDHPSRSKSKGGGVLPVWKSKDQMHPELRKQINEALAGKRRWEDVMSADIRKYNEYASDRGYINPNKMNRFDFETGKNITDAKRYNVEVSKKLENDPNIIEIQNHLIHQQLIGEMSAKTARELMDIAEKNAPERLKATREDYKMLEGPKVLNLSERMSTNSLVNKANTIDKALDNARKIEKPIKKARVFDFDDTVARTKSKVFATREGEVKELTAEEFAKQGEKLEYEGWEMDFSDFNKVVDGKKGPLFDVMKKMKEAAGDRDMFILTARAQESAPAIHRFLKEMGINIPLENIKGLGDSSPYAKSDWVVEKAAEGYNDFYFADDAYQNVKAVRDALEVLDVKSQTQQAYASKDLNTRFNEIIEQKKGIGKEKVFSDIKAEIRGAKARRQKFFIPPSAEDFLGLLYTTLPKGVKGEKALEFYKESLLDPYSRAMENLSTDRVNLMNDFKTLKKELDVPKDLKKQTESGFTNEQAVRVHLWNKTGKEIPGLSKADLKELNDIVKNNPKLEAFADQILAITKGDGYSTPTKNWNAGTITTDLIDVLNTTKRSKYLETWKQNADIIFSKDNLNKLEAAFGKSYREAVENSLARMKSGSNRIAGGNKLSNRILDYINNSTAVTMFMNTRSAILQTISAANFINWSFNSPYHAGKAFANQPQYWRDFIKLMNSDYLVDRRNGLKLNINESEIANAAKTSKNKAKAALSYILEKGYLPTKFADSFAIASGGATWYRNKIKDLMKDGLMTEKEAEIQAMKEFRDIAEMSQQSSDPSKISSQQSSDLGRIILQYVNTPMQYARLQKRDIQDIMNKRRMPGKTLAQSNRVRASRIAYYMFLQNMIFNALQQGLFAIGFGDDGIDEKDEKKLFKTANGMLDSSLRGLGLAGVTVQVIKNLGIDIYDRSQKSRPEYSDAWIKLLEFSPAVKSKLSKLRSAAWPFDSKKRRAEVFEKGFSLDNPAYESMAKVISATTNAPLDRVYSKVNNLKAAASDEAEAWQSIAMFLGSPSWLIMDDEKPKSKSSSKGGYKRKTYKRKTYKR